MLLPRYSLRFIVLHFIYYLTTTTVNGCGQLPSGGLTLRFNIAGFTLPSEMAYTTDAAVPSDVPRISRNEQAAKTFVQNFLKRSVEDVLEQQGRSAFLADAVKSAILQQLTVIISYTPIKCNKVFTSTMPSGGNMWTKICEGMPNNPCMPAQIKEVLVQHRFISGSFMVMWFTTTNVIMANWSTQMWQNILNRVMRSLSSGAFSTNFIGAMVTIVYNDIVCYVDTC